MYHKTLAQIGFAFKLKDEKTFEYRVNSMAAQGIVLRSLLGEPYWSHLVSS